MSATKRSWEWNKDRWGYDGVDVYSGELRWFTQKYNPHHGGGARTQTFEHFLEHGTSESLPSETLAEIQKVVEGLVNES